MSQTPFNPGMFTAPKAKPLPVILLLDTSDSMNIVTNPEDTRRTGQFGTDNDGNEVEYVEGGISRIQVLNEAVRKMIRTLAREERDATEFLVAIITFGADTRLLLPPSPASEVDFADLQAGSMTPLGEALDIAKKLIEDRESIPSRAYRPLVVLVSDGEPNDEWQDRLHNFITEGRSAKCDRMALAIGKEADRTMLARFIAGTEHEVFEADKAEEITNFFKFVTMSVVTRTLSQNPNEIPADSEVKQPPKLAQRPGGEQAADSENVPDQQEQITQQDDDDGYW